MYIVENIPESDSRIFVHKSFTCNSCGLTVSVLLHDVMVFGCDVLVRSWFSCFHLLSTDAAVSEGLLSASDVSYSRD